MAIYYFPNNILSIADAKLKRLYNGLNEGRIVGVK
jgi:hypothetical protein